MTHAPVRFASVARLAAVCAMLALGTSAAQAGQWGAISVDLEKADMNPYYGVGGGASEEEAVANGQKFCEQSGGAHCKNVVTYEQCGAYAASKSAGGWGKAPSKKTAEIQAMAGCADDSCKLVVSDCNDDAQ